MFVGLAVLAPQLIRLFSGVSFEPAIITLQLISPIIIAIGMSNLIGLQVLYPLGKINLVTISTGVGAVSNFTLNCILIPRYAQNGAAIATAVAEISVVLTQIIIARKYIPFRPIDCSFWKYGACALIMGSICYLVSIAIKNDIISLLLTAMLGICTYGTLLIVLKDKIVIETLCIVKNKIQRNSDGNQI